MERKNYLLEIPVYNIQPSGLCDIIKDLTQAFGSCVTSYDGDDLDENYLQYEVLTANKLKLGALANEYGGRVKEID